MLFWRLPQRRLRSQHVARLGFFFYFDTHQHERTSTHDPRKNTQTETYIHILHDITKCNIWLQEAAFPSALQRAHTSSIHRQLNKPRFVAGSRNCMSLCKTKAKQNSKAG